MLYQTSFTISAPLNEVVKYLPGFLQHDQDATSRYRTVSVRQLDACTFEEVEEGPVAGVDITTKFTLRSSGWRTSIHIEASSEGLEFIQRVAQAMGDHLGIGDGIVADQTQLDAECAKWGHRFEHYLVLQSQLDAGYDVEGGDGISSF